MIRRYAAATALAAGLAVTAMAPASAETTAPAAHSPASSSTQNTSPQDASSQDTTQPTSGQAFSSEIKPGHVTSIFSSLVSLATAIFGFIGKVV